MSAKRFVDPDPEEMVLYALLAAIGVIPVAITLVRQAIFGFDATLGLLMVAIGVVGMVVQLARKRVV